MFVRSKLNPIIKPNPKFPWKSRKVYNPSVIFEDNIYHLFYRAVGNDWISKIGYASSPDGETFVLDRKPRLEPKEEYEKNGVEDPRISKVEDHYFLTYTAYDGDTARLALATSNDLITWRRHGIIFSNWDAGKAKSFSVSWDSSRQNSKHKNEWVKAGTIFPEKINGKYWMLFGDKNIWIANSDNGIDWIPDFEPFIEPRKGNYFDSIHIEAGPPPIKTEQGWLCLYHGIDKNIIYRLGLVILNLENPTKIIFRSNIPIFEPEEPYEKSGIVDILPGGFEAMKKMNREELNVYLKTNEKNNRMPKVVFCCGACLVNNSLRIYYGAGDTYICTAIAPIDKILAINK